jgi:hypothetical protein
LFLGTEMGLYVSIDAGRSFKLFKNNIPKTAVMKMAIHPKEHDLVIGTHGRGIFILDDITPLRALTREVAEKDFHLFETKPKIINMRRPVSNGFYGAGNFYGENPSSEIQIIYYQKKRHTFGDLSVEIYDPKGKLIKSVTGGKGAGLNIVEFATYLSIPKAAPTTNIDAMGRGMFPPSLAEGVYTFKIKKGKEEYPGSFEIKYSEDCPYPAADRKIQQELSLKILGMVEQVGYSFYQLKSMHEQADKTAKLMEPTDKKMAKQLTDFARETEKYKATLTALDGDFYIAASENLREDLSRLYSAIVGFPGKPSETSVQRLTYFEGKIKEVQTKFDAYTAQMNKLNEGLVKVQKMPLKIKTFQEFKEDK